MMTTNQTIDGVPRDYVLRLTPEAHSVMLGMVEHCLNVRACMGMDEGFKDFDTEEEHYFVKELRALLDAPAVESELSRMTRRCQNAELALKVQTENYEALKAAQPQGDPVATVMNQPYGMVFTDYKESAFPVGVHVDLYAEQPAPVAAEQNKINHLKQLLRNVRTTLHFSPEDVLAIDAALRENEE